MAIEASKVAVVMVEQQHLVPVVLEPAKKRLVLIGEPLVEQPRQPVVEGWTSCELPMDLQGPLQKSSRYRFDVWWGPPASRPSSSRSFLLAETPR